MLTLKHLGRLEMQDPYLGETLRSLQDAINLHGQIAGIDPTGTFPAPNAPASISVTSAAGGFDISIFDSNPQRGVNYFVEFDASASFPAPRTVPLHVTRNVYLPLGAATYFFRAYSSFPGSNRSAYTNFGLPTGVTGGAAGTPTLQPSQGTGAGNSGGASANPPTGGGFGPVGKQPPPRNFPGGRIELQTPD